jgi:hypothetical protein
MPFRRVTHFRLPTPRTQLWRHVRLSQLLSLLDRKALWFTALSKLEDRFEGAYTLRDMRRLQQLESLTRQARGLPPELVRLDLINRLKAIRARVYVSCWYAGSDESAALWQRSARGSDFVAIQTTFGDLQKTIRQRLPAAYVSYINYERHRIPQGSVLNPFFCKRRIFTHENEFRILLYRAELLTPAAGQYVPASPNSVVRRLMLAPHTEAWVREAIQGLLRRYGVRCPVVHSSVDAQPPWEVVDS